MDGDKNWNDVHSGSYSVDMQQNSTESGETNRMGFKRVFKLTAVIILISIITSCGYSVNASRRMMISKKELKRQGLKVPTSMYTEENLTLLAHLIYAEVGNCKHDETLYLTGAVVLNRVKSPVFPNTIKGVIYQKGQYACTWDGNFKKQPDARSYEIAEELLINGTGKVPHNMVFQSGILHGKKAYKVIDSVVFGLA